MPYSYESLFLLKTPIIKTQQEQPATEIKTIAQIGKGTSWASSGTSAVIFIAFVTMTPSAKIPNKPYRFFSVSATRKYPFSPHLVPQLQRYDTKVE
jgi:hypothetical protein